MELSIFYGIKDINLFSDLPEEKIRELAKLATCQSYEKDQIIVKEGDTSGCFYVVLAGKVRVYLLNKNGEALTLGIQKSHSYFGELSLFDGEPHSANVVAIEDTECAVIERDVFIKWMQKHAKVVMLPIMCGMTERIRKLTKAVNVLSTANSYQRLVYTLMNLIEEEKDGLLITEKTSHADLSVRIGVSREAISKMMGALSRQGYISSKGKRRIIHKPLPVNFHYATE